MTPFRLFRFFVSSPFNPLRSYSSIIAESSFPSFCELLWICSCLAAPSRASSAVDGPWFFKEMSGISCGPGGGSAAKLVLQTNASTPSIIPGINGFMVFVFRTKARRGSC